MVFNVSLMYPEVHNTLSDYSLNSAKSSLMPLLYLTNKLLFLVTVILMWVRLLTLLLILDSWLSSCLIVINIGGDFGHSPNCDTI